VIGTRISAIVDKGKDRGALIGVERVICEQETGAPLATVTSTIFCRGDGGFGDRGDTLPAPHPLPERAPDTVVFASTVNQTALVYRLLGGEIRSTSIRTSRARAASSARSCRDCACSESRRTR
jgi:hypothetical protein